MTSTKFMLKGMTRSGKEAADKSSVRTGERRCFQGPEQTGVGGFQILCQCVCFTLPALLTVCPQTFTFSSLSWNQPFPNKAKMLFRWFGPQLENPKTGMNQQEGMPQVSPLWQSVDVSCTQRATQCPLWSCTNLRRQQIFTFAFVSSNHSLGAVNLPSQISD